MAEHPYDKVRKIEQREIRPTGTFRDPTKNKAEADAKRESVEREMEERVESFQSAMKDPSKRIGAGRAHRKPNPDGPTLGPVHPPVERLNNSTKKTAGVRPSLRVTPLVFLYRIPATRRMWYFLRSLPSLMSGPTATRTLAGRRTTAWVWRQTR